MRLGDEGSGEEVDVMSELSEIVSCQYVRLILRTYRQLLLGTSERRRAREWAG